MTDTFLPSSQIAQAFDLRLELIAELVDPATHAIVLENITDQIDLRGSSIEHDVCRMIHSTARLTFATELNWSAARLRLSVKLTDQTTGQASLDRLGVFLLVTPAATEGATPATYEVDAYDLLTILDTPIPQSWAITAGTSVRQAVSDLLSAAESGLTVAVPPVDTELAADRAWPIGEATWLEVLNDIVVSAGWRPVWAARTGHIETAAWQDPQLLTPLTTFDTTSPTSTVAAGARRLTDTWGIANQWVVINDNAAATNPPAEGDGIVRVRNQGNGPSSILARGRIVNRIERVQATNQGALQAIAARFATEDRLPATRVTFQTAPVPQLWHRDIVELHFPDLGITNHKALVTKWTLPLDGTNASIEAELL